MNDAVCQQSRRQTSDATRFGKKTMQISGVSDIYMAKIFLTINQLSNGYFLGPSCSWGQAAGYQPRPQAGG